VHHPAEDLRHEFAARGILSFLAGNRAVQAKLGIRSAPLFSPVIRRQAQVHLSMPLRWAEQNAGVEFWFAFILGRSVHNPDELITIALFLVKQCSGMVGIAVGTRFESVPVAGEVVLL
jgi:hypothetical protein